MELVRARRGNGLDGLMEGLVSAPSEETRTVKVESNPLFNQLIQKLEEYIRLENSKNRSNQAEYAETHKRHELYLEQEVTEILPPAAMNGFLQLLGKYIMPPNSQTIGIFLTHLIQRSYDVGYNDFYLDTTDVAGIEKIGCTLHGTAKKPLRINVDGPIFNYFLADSRRVIATLTTESYPLFTAIKAKNIALTINGPAGVHCGKQAEYSSFIINGSAGSLHQGFGLGINAWFSQFYIREEYDPLDGKTTAFGCTFKTSNEQTMGNIIGYLPLGNRAIFVHPNGKEETLWKKHFVERIRYKWR